MFTIFKIVITVVISFFLYNVVKITNKLYEVPPVPVLPEDAWWGPGQPKELTDSVRPFTIQIQPEVIKDLHERLDRYLKKEKNPSLENSAFIYGFNREYLESVVEFWRLNYNWTDREAYLNQYAHYKTYVNGLDIHFIRVSPRVTSNKTILPLLLLHGWPGSVREFYDIIPFLMVDRDDKNFLFELVIPSLPGYGFSQGSSKPGFGAAQMAVVLKNLMERLGLHKFYVQGGDWGSQIAKYLGILFPDKILGVHGNMCFVLNFQTPLRWIFGTYLPFLSQETGFYDKLYPLLSKTFYILQELGYMHLQASKPDSLGVALEDSPAGLAAYILEKFSCWTNREWKWLPDGGLTRKFKLEALLDNVMIYWVTASMTTSQRLYAETFNVSQILLRLEEIPLRVPTACARFPEEIFWLSKPFLKGIYVNLVQITDFEEGGHFPAFEVPRLLSEDIWKAVEVFQNLNQLK